MGMWDSLIVTFRVPVGNTPEPWSWYHSSVALIEELPHDMDEAMVTLAKDGWEPVSTTTRKEPDTQANWFVVTYKRPRPSESAYIR